MMVERYPNLKEEVGGLNPGCEISSLSDEILATWSIASCALALACRLFVSQKKRKKEKIACKLLTLNVWLRGRTNR
jgi:hypothetical protein